MSHRPLVAFGIATLIGGICGLDSADAQPKDKDGLVATTQLEYFAGESLKRALPEFQMEGTPRVETVFGDVASFKARIDRFSEVQGKMESERRRFAAAAHALQTILGPTPRVGIHKRSVARPPATICSDDERITQATDAHSRFRELGVDLERNFQRIRGLHQVGESTGLTPDYRRRVLQSRSVYRQALSDLTEMNAVMQKQLQPALAKATCSKDALALEAKTPTKNTSYAPGIPARAVTFFVDNRACNGGLDVYVNARLLGHVMPGANAAFQSLSGRHSLCLLAEDSVASCGDTGTLRTAFVHDGFRIQRSCGLEK